MSQYSPLPEGLRSRSDLKLRDTLMADQDIRRGLEQIERHRGPSETRRQLLAGAIRLTPGLAPDVHRVVDSCRDRLGYKMPLELFVYPSASFNAAAARPEDDMSFVLLASSLLEAFSDDELGFVIGHELGHHIFHHHEIPVGTLLNPGFGLAPAQALQLFAWSRFAEISADRAGLYCCQNLDAAGRALFKLASGLQHPLTDRVVEVMLEQMTEIEAVGSPKDNDVERSDWSSTHPFSPIRIKAGKLFIESTLMQSPGTPIDELELNTEEILHVMELGYLKASTDAAKAMRRLLLAGGMLVADASRTIDEKEVEALDKLLGDGTVTDKLDIDALKGDLDRRIKDVVELTTPGRRVQVLRDLCLIAQADGCTSAPEKEILTMIANKLGLENEIWERMIDGCYALD